MSERGAAMPVTLIVTVSPPAASEPPDHAWSVTTLQSLLSIWGEQVTLAGVNQPGRGPSRASN
jgi:hypothetical protein